MRPAASTSPRPRLRRSAITSPSSSRAKSRRTYPKGFLPIQSGVGQIANAVLGALGNHPEIPAFEMYTEVLQDSVVKLIERGAGEVRQSTLLAHGQPRQALQSVYENLEWFRPRILLRPQEITNNPEVIRRLGIISINTAIEIDIFGNVNSTHVMGRQMMNGIGGSGDFTRNAYLSVFTCPSTAKGGKINNRAAGEPHGSQRALGADRRHGVRHRRPARPFAVRARHADHRELRAPGIPRGVDSYLEIVEGGHTPHTLTAAFKMHEQFQRTGDMRGVDWVDVSAATK